VEVVYLEAAEKLAHKTIFEGFVAVVRSKNTSPTWSDVKLGLSASPAFAAARASSSEPRTSQRS
jgi:hypothetical protein